MTATHFGGESMLSAASRLLRGDGTAAVATTAFVDANGVRTPAVSLGPSLHGLTQSGEFIVLTAPLHSGDERAHAGREEQAREVVVMIDDFAPSLQIRAAVGSLRFKGTLRPVMDLSAREPNHPLLAEQNQWPGSQLYSIEPFYAAASTRPERVISLTRLGVSVDLDFAEAARAEIDVISAQAFGVYESLAGRSDIDLSALVAADIAVPPCGHEHGCRHEHGVAAVSVHLLAADTHGLHVLAGEPGAMVIHRAPFSGPVACLATLTEEVARLCAPSATEKAARQTG